ncbi:membrane protein [Beggiatoa sp. PS]|nr:membrane protein [Beggiatoa sp. PS]
MELPLSAKEIAKTVEMINLSNTIETDFQALEELPLSFKEFEELPLSAKEIVKPFVPIVTIVIFSLLVIISLISAFSTKSEGLKFLFTFGFLSLIVMGVVFIFMAFFRLLGSRDSHDSSPGSVSSQIKEIDNQPDFLVEFVSFLKSKGYPPSSILYNTKIWEIYVDCLITLPNLKENLAIITAQSLNERLIKMKVEICQQKMEKANSSSVCILIPTTKAQEQYPFSLYYIDNNGNFQKLHVELLPTFQELSVNSPILEQPLFSQMAKPAEMGSSSGTMETNFQASSTDAENKKQENFYKVYKNLYKERLNQIKWFLPICSLVIGLFVLIGLFTPLRENKMMFFVWLIIYLIIIFTMIIIDLLLTTSKNHLTKDFPIPSLTALNPYEIAALRNGRKGVIHTALFNLFRKELIMSEKIAESNVVTVNNSPTQQSENAIEEAIYQFAAKKSPIPKDFFTDLSLRATLDKLMEPINQKLMQMHLKSDLELEKNYESLFWKLWWIFIIYCTSYTGFMIMMEIGTEPGNYISLGFFVMNFFFVFIYLSFKNAILGNPDNTQLGKRYLEKLTEHFQWAKLNKSSGIAPILIVAIYGIKGLEDSPLGFEAFSDLSELGTQEGGCGGCGGCGGGCGGG